MKGSIYKEDIGQTLIDAGCGPDTISAFLQDLKENKNSEGLELLAAHRRKLLEKLHEYQKKIDCLDFFVYQCEKGKISAN